MLYCVGWTIRVTQSATERRWQASWNLYCFLKSKQTSEKPPLQSVCYVKSSPAQVVHRVLCRKGVCFKGSKFQPQNTKIMNLVFMFFLFSYPHLFLPTQLQMSTHLETLTVKGLRVFLVTTLCIPIDNKHIFVSIPCLEKEVLIFRLACK